MPTWAIVVLAATLLAYAGFLAWLLLAGRRAEARAVAGFLPDCVVLLRRIARDTGTPRRTKLVLGLTVAYLVFPIDLVPDVLPVVGQLDDALVLALALRHVLRAVGPAAVDEHWPGPDASLRVVRRVARGSGR